MGKEKIFCISYQRTGTTSVSKFYRMNGYKVVDWSFDRKSWTEYFINGDYEKIFRSKEFRKFQVFEDHPWFLLDFYRVVYHRFPDAKFVHFVRDSNDWFESLKYLFDEVHSAKAFYWHYKAYGLLDEYYRMIETSRGNERPRLLIGNDQKEHFVKAYETANRDITEFFKTHDKSRIIQLELEDPDKWSKLAEFSNISNNKAVAVHENISNR